MFNPMNKSLTFYCQRAMRDKVMYVDENKIIFYNDQYIYPQPDS